MMFKKQNLTCFLANFLFQSFCLIEANQPGDSGVGASVESTSNGVRANASRNTLQVTISQTNFNKITKKLARFTFTNFY